jgi:hypothetical protein
VESEDLMGLDFWNESFEKGRQKISQDHCSNVLNEKASVGPKNHARALFAVSRDIVHSNSARIHADIVERATAKPFSVCTIEKSALEITFWIEYQSVHLPALFRLMMNSSFRSLLLDVPTLS